MKIKIKRSCSIKGMGHVEEKAVIEVSDSIGHALIAIGKAVKHHGEKSKKGK